MKIRVMLKDPDTMSESCEDAAKRLPQPEGVRESEWAEIRAARALEANQIIAEKWMEYGEYLMVEFDTETETATVIPIKDYR